MSEKWAFTRFSPYFERLPGVMLDCHKTSFHGFPSSEYVYTARPIAVSRNIFFA
ncbi:MULTISPECIES: hypothetical protein [unclassified Burkholderia]|uniref:hypothetical protein n=1 Tax=unclassified Burkholderia TaxID=2613784 RepID=UPI0016238C07|nr:MULTISPECIES: hypothetical protein [unclassified Burkholderia]